MDELLTELNAADAFDNAVTASVSGGQIVLEDTTGGSSQLALSIVAHNEGGGTLDFGDFSTTTFGRKREIVSGADAAVRVDGVYSTSATNSISGAIPGVSLTATAVTSEPGVITLSRNTDAVVSSVKALVDAYNGVAAFVTDQFTGGAGSKKPLAGDSTLRGMLSTLRSTLQTTLTTGVGGSWSRLADLGVEIQKDGTFLFTDTKLKDALASDPTAVERLFGVHGAATGAGLKYVASSDATKSGTYTVAVTTPASVASATGSADLTVGYTALDDTVTITDLGSRQELRGEPHERHGGGRRAGRVPDGAGHAEGPHRHVRDGAESDALGTLADEDTTWADLHQGTASAGFQNGDSITISGRRADATSFYKTLSITDAATQTLSELKDLIQNAVGADATVALVDGKFVVTAEEEGSSLIELTLSATRQDETNALDISTEVGQEGRAAARIDASLTQDGRLNLVHQDYGSSAGFRITYANGSAEAGLGLGATDTEYKGADVAGTIGGMAATGSGRTLTGADGTDVEGLLLTLEPSFTGGSITFSRGIASLLQLAVEPLLGTEQGSIKSLIDGLDGRITGMNDRIDDIDARLERRRDDLIRRFTAMEQAMSQAQSQSNWLASTIGSLPGAYSGNNGG